MRVGVIGAGAAGLCAARHITAMSGLGNLVVYEQSENVGGTWIYTDKTGLDDDGLPIHSSMYRNMKTNLPKEVMGFPDYPFPNDTPQSFIPHTAVRTYLDKYASHFDLDKFIRFRTCVREVERIASDKTWLISSENLDTKQRVVEAFDALFVCNGHYFVPHIPPIPGIDAFSGTVLHSHDYRTPDRFAGLRVACLGAGPSGIDIAIELAGVCSKVFLCHGHEPLQSYLPPNVKQGRGFQQFGQSQSKKLILLDDGEEIEVDAVIFCTGYRYGFPFFKTNLDVELRVNSSGVSPLFQHMVHIEEPTLFLIGLCATICPFPNFDTQVRYAVSLLTGNCSLPSTEDMYEWERSDLEQRKTNPITAKKGNRHFLGSLQWDYIKTLAELGNFPNKVPPVIQDLYDEVHKYRVRNLVTYKTNRFEILNDENYRKI